MGINRKPAPAERPERVHPLWHARHWIQPPAAAAIVLAVASAFYELVAWTARTHTDHETPRLIVAMLLALGSFVVTLVAAHSLQSRPLMLRAGASTGVAVAGLWTCITVVWGPPWAPMSLAVLAVVVVTVTPATAIPRTWRGDGGEGIGLFPNAWRRITRNTDLEATRARDVGSDTKTLRGTIALNGVSPSTLINSREELESAGNLPVGGLKLVKDLDNAGKVHVTMSTTGAHRLPKHPWPGPAGTSILEPRPVGIADTGQVVRIMPAKGHMGVCGQSGSGKSNAAQLEALATAACIDAVSIAFDPKRTEFLRWKGIMPLVCDDKAHAQDFMAAVMALIEHRQDVMAEHGWRDWPISAEYPLLNVLMDEAALAFGSVSGNRGAAAKDWSESMLIARAAGVRFKMYAQRFSLASLNSSDARAQISDAISFGVEEKEDARFLISKRVLSQVDPSDWGNRFPGLCIVEVEGWDTPQVPVRYFEVTDDVLAKAIAYYREHGTAGQLPAAELDILSRAMTAMDTKNDRDRERRRRNGSGRPPSPPTPAITSSTPPTPAPSSNGTKPGSVSLEKGTRAPASAQAMDKQSEDEALDTLGRLLAAEQGTSPGEIHKQTGWSRNWVHDQLDRLRAEGAVVKVATGRYRAALDH